MSNNSVCFTLASHLFFKCLITVDMLNIEFEMLIDCGIHYLSVTAYIIALLHVGLLNVVYLTACAFIRS